MQRIKLEFLLSTLKIYLPVGSEYKHTCQNLSKTGLEYYRPVILVKQDYLHARKYMFNVNNRNNRKRCEIYSKLIIETPEGCH